MKIKKLLSILLAAVLIIGCISISASAADETVTVSLLGEKQAIVSEEYEVMINVAETTADLVGGISCDVNYDTTKFTFKRIEIGSKFAATNGLNDDSGESKIVNTSEAGVVSVVLLDVPEDTEKSNWLTIVFGVNADQDEGTASFGLANIKVADATGAKLLTNSLTVDVTKNIYAHMINVNGASIKKDGAGEIRFEAEIDASVDRSQIEEIGFLMIPAVCLKDGLYNGDLTFTDSGVYTTAIGKTATIVSNCKIKSEIDDNESKIYCYLSDTLDYKLSMAFAARAYIKMTDGTIIYSDNQTYVADSNTYEKNIKGGTSSKSCIETAKAIYNIYKNNENVTFSDEFKNIIVKDSWDNTEYKTIVAELANVSDSFN